MKKLTRDQTMDVLAVIAILVSMLILVHLLWPKQPIDNQNDVQNAVLQERIYQDSIKIQNILQVNDSLEKEIVRNQVVIADLNKNIKNIEKKYHTQKKELDKLSDSELLDQFVDLTGGRLDSLYSLPRMNLLNALTIFVERNEFSDINLELRRIVSNQEEIIDLKDNQLENVLNVTEILNQNIDNYKLILQNQIEKENKLVKELKRKDTANKILLGTNAATLLLLLLK